MTDDDIDALMSFVRTVQSEINTSMPGKVVSYDAATGLAVVKPDIPKQIADGRVIEAPAIHNVPVRWFTMDVGGAIAQISGPLKPGDGVAIMFSQRSIDGWVQGSSGAPDDPRMHDLSDAYCIPGLNPGGVAAPGDSENVVIKYGPGGFRIASDGTITVFGPGIVYDAPQTSNAPAQFNRPVTMSPDAPIDAQGGFTGKDGITFENHTHSVPNVQGGTDTATTTLPDGSA